MANVLMTSGEPSLTEYRANVSGRDETSAAASRLGVIATRCAASLLETNSRGGRNAPACATDP